MNTKEVGLWLGMAFFIGGIACVTLSENAVLQFIVVMILAIISLISLIGQLRVKPRPNN